MPAKSQGQKTGYFCAWGNSHNQRDYAHDRLAFAQAEFRSHYRNSKSPNFWHIVVAFMHTSRQITADLAELRKRWVDFATRMRPVLSNGT
ncbi:MAG: hypothetical protein AAF636_22100 [Pseudomonadota bacterium]